MVGAGALSRALLACTHDASRCAPCACTTRIVKGEVGGGFGCTRVLDELLLALMSTCVAAFRFLAALASAEPSTGVAVTISPPGMVITLGTGANVPGCSTHLHEARAGAVQQRQPNPALSCASDWSTWAASGAVLGIGGGGLPRYMAPSAAH